LPQTAKWTKPSCKIENISHLVGRHSTHCGSTLKQKAEIHTIGDNRVWVPHYIYKLVYNPSANKA
jgi:hypothetical protein